MTKKKGSKQEKIFSDGLAEITTSLQLTTPEQTALDVLAKHKHIYDFYMNTGELVNFHLDIREEIVNAYKYWEPHYHYNKTCTICVAEMIRTIYNFYNKKINQ